MNDATYTALTTLAAYLIGAVPFGYLVARARGVNIFEKGSGNIGATNVGRVLGRKFGILVFVLDFLKGAGPVLAADFWVAPRLDAVPPAALGVAVGLAAILGHVFPVYLKFRGGKGVATAAGVVFMLLPVPASFALLAWVGVVAATGYVSAASLAAAAALCLARLAYTADPFAADRLPLTLFCLAVAALVFVRHRGNIGRLLTGKENQIKDSATMQKLTRILHVMTVGLWFGMAVFFSFPVALILFDAMETIGKNVEGRPEWFPLVEPWNADPAQTEPIDPAKEQGTRAAGKIISPMFDVYFLMQGVLGFLALAACWGWQYRHAVQKIHARRVTVLILALMTVVVGWAVERQVSELRVPRDAAVYHYLETVADDAPEAEVRQARDEALEQKSTFTRWHLISLFLNFGTIFLVGAATGMASALPPLEPRGEQAPKPG